MATGRRKFDLTLKHLGNIFMFENVTNNKIVAFERDLITFNSR